MASILIVDDLPENLSLLTNILMEAGYNVRQAKNGEQALRTAKASPPDLILLDIKMPEMDGFEVCEKLREDKHTTNVPIIFVSALQDIHDRVHGFEVGGVDYINKPIQHEEVLARVRTHLELHHMRENLEQVVSERTAELADAYRRVSISEAKYRRLVESLRSGFFIYAHDTNGDFYYVSPSVTNVLGYSQEEFSTHYAEYLTDNPINEDAKRFTELAIHGEAQAPYELEIYHKDGGVHHLQIGETPVFNEQGEVEAVEGIAHDISERKAYENSLRQAKKEAEYANHAKTQFLANMSHELRTPLNGIIGFSEMMTQEVLGPIPKAYSGYAADIYNSGQQLLELITDILDISTIDMDVLVLHETDIDLRAMLTSCIRAVQEKANAKQIALSMEMPADIPHLNADKTRVKEILLNLLSNAVKFTPLGGYIKADVYREDDGAVTLRVEDSGCGMAAEDIPNVLEPFSQLEDIFTRSHEGCGLGLPISKRLIELHGGSLTIDSELGKGTSVIVRFPSERIIDNA
ncbi:response regulator [Pseudomonadota bacterium]